MSTRNKELAIDVVKEIIKTEPLFISKENSASSIEPNTVVDLIKTIYNTLEELDASSN